MKHHFTTWFVFLFFAASAENRKDTLALQEVVKLETLSNETSVASPLASLKYNSGNRLSDALNECSSVYVKTYGNGQLASIAVRGTSATQTEVQWNGMRLNSPSLGQTDLALFVLGMQEQVTMVRTGMRGVIGGTLMMDNTVVKDTGVHLNATLRGGSFKTFESVADLRYLKGRVSGFTKLSYARSDNDYPFRNRFQEGLPFQRQTNAATQQLSFMQQFNVAINDNHSVMANVWLTEANRQIAPIISKPNSTEHQQDYSLRSMLGWKGKFKSVRLNVTSLYTRDVLRYVNPEAKLDETSLMQAWRNKVEATMLLPKNIRLQAELDLDYESAEVKAYQQTRGRFIGSLKSYLVYYLRGWKFHGGFRQDLIGNKLSAFSPELAVSYSTQVNQKHQISAGLIASRNFRFPTLNDLYWLPGGNPNLKQEKSWNGEISLQYSYLKTVQFTINNFYLYVDDWIQWTPTGSFWSPQNIRRVFSRGLETTLLLTNAANNDNPKQFQVHGSVSYTFTQTTNLDGQSTFDESKGKQLIYVPMHNAVASLQLSFRGFYVRSIHRYISQVFIATDNSDFLPAYYLTNLEIGKEFTWQNRRMAAAFKINNVGNTNYENVAQRPMPGRSFEGILRFNL
jgi:iron complex outermembrane receptor protein